MKKFYPSAASFSVGTQSQTEKSSGCFRNILIKGNGVREPDIDPKYAKMGAQFEDLVQASEDWATNAQREVPFRLDCGDDVFISGRCDFLTDMAVHECKASQSDYVKRSVKKGIPVQDHVAQLLLYMSHFEKDQGFLHYGLYSKEKTLKDGTVQPPEFKEWIEMEVFINDDDEIEVNGEVFHWGIPEFETFIKTAIDVLKNDQLLGRPYKALDFMSPCKYCIFAPICDRLDAGSIKGARAFIREAQLHIDSLNNGAKK